MSTGANVISVTQIIGNGAGSSSGDDICDDCTKNSDEESPATTRAMNSSGAAETTGATIPVRMAVVTTTWR